MPVPTKSMIFLQPTYAFVKDEVSESTMGRFYPENLERTICLDYLPRDGVRFRCPVGVDEAAVVDRDGGVSARFEVGFVS